MESNTVQDPEQYVQFAIICAKKKKNKTKNRRMSKRFYVHGIVLEGSFTKCCFIFFGILNNANVLSIINEIFCHYKNNLLYCKYHSN